MRARARALNQDGDMRTAITVLFVLTVIVAIAVVGLYLRAPAVPVGSTANDVSEPRMPSITTPNGATDGGEWREPLEKLNRKLDQLSSELESLRQAREREPIAAEHAPSEEEFRVQHERTILSVIADDRDRLASEATIKQVQGEVAAFWQSHELPEVRQAAVVDVLLEGENRAKALLRRFAPDGKWPGSDDPGRKDWERAWGELRSWRNAELSRSLDPTTIEQLLEKIRFHRVSLVPY